MNEVKSPKKPLMYYYTIVLILLLVFNFVAMPWISEHQIKEVDYNTFINMVDNGEVSTVEIQQQNNRILFQGNDNRKIYKTAMLPDNDLVSHLLDANVSTTGEEIEQTSALVSILAWVLPIILFVALGQFMSRKMMEKMGGGNSMMFNMGKSNARVYVKSAEGIKFADVAGEDEAKENLSEIVDYLHDPGKYREIGASMPKGILLVGPPGTGKTMLAKAVAGEADVPFFSMSGSEFVEMFVGMGASKVRDLFKQAKEKAPCIVFIDEIDAIGKKRDGQLGGNDEREQTLNQLLTEMDGFEGNNGVIILAATNRPDVLDSALLRPGRFDRQVVIDLPDVKGREEILKIHAAKIKLDPSVDLETVAKITPGCSGADLANLLNEGAIIAARRNESLVTMEDIDEARDKVFFGRERRKLMDSDEKKLTAYHEAGHALIQAVIDDGRLPIHKVTIIPRGQSLGSTMFVPSRDIRTESKKSLLNHICTSLGGRVAEEIVFTDITNGAAGDIKQATKIARKMVCDWGMGEIGPIALGENQDHIFLGKEIARDEHFSEKTAQLVDDEIKAIVDGQLDRARKIVSENRDKLDIIANELLIRETIDGADVYKIVRGEFTPTPAPEKTDGKTAAEISEEEKIEQEKHDDGDEGIIAPPLPDNG